MAAKRSDDHYSKEEAQRRFEAALRGARIAGPKPMDEIAPKRTSKTRKAKRKKAQK